MNTWQIPSCKVPGWEYALVFSPVVLILTYVLPYEPIISVYVDAPRIQHPVRSAVTERRAYATP